MSECKMRLGDVVAFLRAQDGATLVEHGFGVAGSWRGDYSEVAFRPETGTTVAAMLMHAESVMGSTITGYKGGHYWVDEHTPCNVAEWGCYDETDGLTLERLCAMCGVQPELEQVKAERDRLAAEVAQHVDAYKSAHDRAAKAEAEVARLTARWERLSTKLRDERLASLDRPVEGYTDGLDNALYMMAALEREGKKR